MNNLKRVLSLALSGIMLVGMMAIGAGAVNGKDFTDQAEIQNTEAVNTLVTLNVINGKDDGSHYDPKGTLTRAEMCKLIVYVLNGGKEPVLSTKATPTYSDIKGHWAEKYIEYCSNLKIVAGQGDGTFNPGGILTGSQAAKMMLTAMNYNSDVFHFTGSDWELSVTSEANKAKLFKGMDGLVASDPINRDNAAQLVYNGIQAKTMERRWAQNMTDLQITENYQLTGPTLFSDKFDGVAYEGVLYQSGKYTLDTTNAPIDGDKFSFYAVKRDGVELAAPGTQNAETKAYKAYKYVGQDLTPLMGEYVKVLYNAKEKVVYGVYRVEDMNTVVNTTSNLVEVKESTIEVDGVSYDKDSAFSATIDGDAADKVKLVDNDGDDDIDLAVVVTQGVAKVTFVGTDSITLAKKGGNANLKASNQKTTAMIVYDGIAKGDYVVYHRDMYKNKDVLEKAELVEGEISGVGTATTTNDKYQIAGKWYKKATNGTIYTGRTVGDKVKFFALENKIYYMEKVSGSHGVEDLAMVITSDTGSGTGNNIDNQRVKLLFSDGSKKVVTLASGAGDNSTAATSGYGKLFSFEVNNSGEYTLTEAKPNAWKDNDGNNTSKMGDYTWTNGAAGDLGAGNNKISTVGSYVIADEAVVFAFAYVDSSPAMNPSNDGKIMTGKELKALTAGSDNAKIATQSAGFFTSSSNGLTRATVLCVALGAQATDGFNTLTGKTSNNYGYLVSDATYTKVDGTKYVVMKLWNGEETIDVKWAKSSADTTYTNYKKHDVIGYDVKGDGVITNVTHMVDDVTASANFGGMYKAAVTGLDGKEISFTDGATGLPGSQVYKITGDTKILYVNSAADTADAIGVADGNVALANKPAGTDTPSNAVYVQNVKYVWKTVGTEKQIELLVYDVNNTLADRDNVTVTPSWTHIKTIAVNGKEYTAGNVKLHAGDVVKVTTDAAGTATVSGLIHASVANTGATDTQTTVAADKTETYIVPKLPATITIS